MKKVLILHGWGGSSYPHWQAHLAKQLIKKNYTVSFPSLPNKDEPKLDEWLKHTIPHFERENTLMQKTGFPAFGVHSEEHEIALSRMKNVFEVWKQKKDIDLLADYVFNMWPNWFNGHVNSMDMMTAKFAVMNGFDPQAMA